MKIALTGGPCCGKTTTINILKDMGFTTTPEAGRIIIHRLKAYGVKIPPDNRLQFEMDICDEQIHLELEAKLKDKSGFIFTDRGMPDMVAFCETYNVNLPKLYLEKVNQHVYDFVFEMEPIEEYVNDSGRFHTPEQAKIAHEMIIKTWKAYGYNPIIVPVMDPHKRAEFIIKKLGIEKGKI